MISLSVLSTNGFKIGASSIAYVVISLSITLRLVLGNRTLDIFYPYTAEGGNPLLKIHPGTWLLLVGFALYGFARGYGRLLYEIVNHHKPAIIALIATIVLILYTVAMWGKGGAAYLVDTYTFAIVCLIMATQLTYRQCLGLFKLIAIIIAVNCLIAIFEFLTRAHFLPNSATGTRFFRANALMGHPLNNALITLSVALAVFIAPFSNIWRYAMLSLALFAILAFATRASLVMYVAAVVFIIWSYSFTTKMKKRKRQLWVVVSPLLAAFCFIVFYFIVFFTGIGDGIASRSSLDDSAMARTHAITFFTGLPLGKYFFGVGNEEFMSLVSLYSAVPIIENFWIQLVVTYGVPMFFALLVSYGKLIKWIVGRANFQAYILVAVWLIAASTNNSLSIKTSALAVFLLILYLLSRIIIQPNKTKD